MPRLPKFLLNRKNHKSTKIRKKSNLLLLKTNNKVIAKRRKAPHLMKTSAQTNNSYRWLVKVLSISKKGIKELLMKF